MPPSRPAPSFWPSSSRRRRSRRHRRPRHHSRSISTPTADRHRRQPAGLRRARAAGVRCSERTQLEQKMLNDRLNTQRGSCCATRSVTTRSTQYVADFQHSPQADPSLWGKLYAQATSHTAGCRRKSTASVRITRSATIRRRSCQGRGRGTRKVGGRMAQQPERAGTGSVSPAAGLPPSLANARSVAGRTTSDLHGACPDGGAVPRA